MKGHVSLEDCLIKEADSETKHSFSFAIIPSPSSHNKKTYLYAESQQEMDDWVIAINQQIVNHRKSTENH